MAETIYLAIGPEQAEGLINDLQQSIDVGAGSILIITSNKPEAVKALEEMRSDWAAGGGDVSNLPEPDIVCISTIFTVATPADMERLGEFLAQWAVEVEDESLAPEHPGEEEVTT